MEPEDTLEDVSDDVTDDSTEEVDETDEGQETEESEEDESSSDGEESEDSEEDGEETEEESEEEDSEDTEESEPDDDDVDETLESVDNLDRPSVKDIKEKYPKFFKDFPELRHAFFREREFSNLFASVDEAKEASTKSDALDNLEKTIIEGNLHPLFETLHKNDPAVLKTFVNAFLPTLYEGSQELFAEVTDPILKNFIAHVAKEGERVGGEKGKNMVIAAKYFAHELTGKTEIPTGGLKRQNDSPEVSRIREERNREVQERFNEFKGDVRKETDARLAKMIMKDLDPNNALPKFTRDALRMKINDEIRKKLREDRQYQSRMNVLWSRAQKVGFRGDAKAQLVTTFLGRARQLLVPIRQQARKEAQLGKGEKKQVKKVLRGGTATGKTAPTKLDPKSFKGMSDMDILNDKPPVKRP